MMKIKNALQLFCIIGLMSCQSTGTSQTGSTDMRTQFFPATDLFYAGVNVYSTSTGEFAQYNVEDGKWVQNSSIKTPALSIAGGGYRMTYFQGDQSVLPTLFVYSTVTAEYEFFYMEGGVWKSNTNLPKGKIYFNSRDVRMEYSPAGGGKTAFLTASSTAGNEIKVLEVIEGKWNEISFFPSRI